MWMIRKSQNAHPVMEQGNVRSAMALETDNVHFASGQESAHSVKEQRNADIAMEQENEAHQESGSNGAAATLGRASRVSSFRPSRSTCFRHS